jgi:Ca-activated chloride channel family protein
MMLLSPRVELPSERIVERDVVFVVDVSGSMAGEKIKQARGALKHCLNSLNDGDRFAIVPFSSFAEPWRKDLASAATDRKAALAFADALIAQGGTDIAGALDVALSFPRSADRPYFVMFMTDGKPTLGETTDPKRILARTQAAKGAARIFTWGVGYDVDAQLLDAMAETAGGVSEYVRPEEDIEAKVSSFFAKASRPVLTDLKLEVVGEKIQLVNVFPRALPDLYAGGQIVLFGRYTGAGDVALRLTGSVGGKTETFIYEMGFAEKDGRHAFVEPLWARRRIGALLDQIRLHGETKELVDDVIRLSKEYGIQTPYTSSLILEPGMAMPVTLGGGRADAQLHREFDRRRANEEKLGKLVPKPSAASAPPPPADAAARQAQAETAKDLAEGFAKRDGASAVKCAQYLKNLKEGENGAAQGWAPTVRACNTNFRQLQNLWVDDRFEAAQNTTVVKFGSPAYFRILELKPELNDAFKVGAELVLVTAPKQALVVSSTGLESLDDEKIAALFR